MTRFGMAKTNLTSTRLPRHSSHGYPYSEVLLMKLEPPLRIAKEACQPELPFSIWQKTGNPMKTARLCGIGCILFLFWCGNITAQDNRGVPQIGHATQAERLSAEELFKRISPSVFVVESLDATGQAIEQGSAVVIRVEHSSPAALPTGFVPDNPGSLKPAVNILLITNYHVVKDGVNFRVRHGQKVWPADLVTFDASHDLAELKVKGLKAPQYRSVSLLHWL